MRPARSTLFLATAALLALTACGTADDDAPADAVDGQTTDADDQAESPDDDASADTSDDDGASTGTDGSDDRMIVSLDGVALDALPDALQCVAFPDGTDRITAEVSDPSVADDDPEARMSLVLDDDGEQTTVRISAGLNVPDETNGSWAADPADASAIDVDPEVGASFEDLTVELEDLLYDDDPSPQQRSLSVDIDCT